MKIFSDQKHIFDNNLFIILSVSLFLLSFVTSTLLIFGPDIYNLTNSLLIQKIEFKFSFSSFCGFNLIYTLLLIFPFFYNNESRIYYIRIMKKFKSYNGNYRTSHLIIMSKLFVLKLLIILSSIAIGNAFIILKNGNIDKSIPLYKLFSYGFLIILPIILLCIGLCLKWMKDELFTETYIDI